MVAYMLFPVTMDSSAHIMGIPAHNVNTDAHIMSTYNQKQTKKITNRVVCVIFFI